MTSNRKQILTWAEQGHLKTDSLPEALALAGAEPIGADWRTFVDRLMLWAGAIFVALGVIFFFAYNWQAMGRFAKFGLVELLMVAAVALVWKLGLDSLSGKAALFAATLLVGGLLALVGQTYQTGADPWQLFAAWALFTLPWAAVARFGPLLLFWIGLVNLSLILYFQTFPRTLGLLGVVLSTESLLWLLFVVNTAALGLWEWAALRRAAWLGERWALRVLAVASGSLITTLAVWAIFEPRSIGNYPVPIYFAWLGAAYWGYRRRLRDIFVLAGGVLSVIVVVTALLSKGMFDGGDEGGLLIIGMVIVGLSAAGGAWLRAVAREEGA